MADDEEVEVRTRYCGDWVGGYEVVEREKPDDVPAPKVKVRRRSDGRVLPEPFDSDEVRPGS